MLNSFWCLSGTIIVYFLSQLSGCSHFPSSEGASNFLENKRDSSNRSVPLRELSNRIVFGSAIRKVDLLQNDVAFRDLILQEYSSLTHEGAMKFRKVRAKIDLWDWKEADQFAAFATVHGQYIHGHTLLWHRSHAPWVFELSKADLQFEAKKYIQDSIERYGEKVRAWDVINEPFQKDGTLRSASKVESDFSGSIWANLGPDYVAQAFLWAEEATKQFTHRPMLLLNEFGVETENKKSNGLFNLVKDLKMQKIPIDGIGFQMHLSLSENKDIKKFELDLIKNFSRFEKLGVSIHITELDVEGCFDLSCFQVQAEVYGAVARACEQTTTCLTFTTWGASDKYSWLRDPKWGGAKSEMQKPLPFDEKFLPKPAYFEIRRAFGILKSR